MYIHLEAALATAKVFQSGNSRAVRLPKEFSLPLGEVEISRDGSKLVLEPKDDNAARVVELLSMLSDAFNERPADDPPQQREGL